MRPKSATLFPALFVFVLFVLMVIPKKLVVPTAEAAARAPLGFGGGGGTDGPHDELTAVQQQTIHSQLDANIAQLTALGKLPQTTPLTVSFIWPLQPSPYLNDYNYYGVSGFVDHNPNFPNQVVDYACSDRTYDTAGGYNHRGTDIFLWPFSWNKVDNDEVQVVAAAPGVIIGKQDGNYDRNCSPNNSPWNAVYVQHSDGSVAWYGHLKRGSLTTKGIGSTVATGEYLGIVGSSGNSTGPHLHFEVHDASNQLIDPYAGACNSANAESWWVEQRPYFDSAVNAVTTGDAPVQLNTCPAQDTPNIQDNFTPGDFVYFTTYYHDQIAGQTSQYTIYQPNGDVYYSWSYEMEEEYYQWSYWWWYFWIVPDFPPGTWRFEVQFEGQTYTTYFNWGDPTYIEVTSPQTDDIWNPGTTHTITWDDNLGGDVRLELYQNNQLHSVLAYTTPSDGEFEWVVPPTFPYETSYQIKIINITNDTLTAESGEFNTGVPITVTRPQGGEVLSAGQPYTITWQYPFTDAVRLELWHMGSYSSTITETTPNSGLFTWTLPLTVSHIVGYQVRVVSSVNGQWSGLSGSFSIGEPLSTFLPVVLKKE